MLAPLIAQRLCGFFLILIAEWLRVFWRQGAGWLRVDFDRLAGPPGKDSGRPEHIKRETARLPLGPAQGERGRTGRVVRRQLLTSGRANAWEGKNKVENENCIRE